MPDLANDFSLKVYNAIQESNRIGYSPTVITTILRSYDAVSVAKKLIKSGTIQSGFKKLSGLGRIDLSFESIMLESDFCSLFTKEELRAAEWRLSSLK
ncbi:hypothetical protein [Moritella sp. Urea-trap-13]|uniref:hypothetical protein n=1 Tax=Moritella sp. Urea-trap-13 TaxID=2058327 RepID=UPI000C33A835|nr:hypothetical protein [Moritella sp. Urea-trap-13]PKH06417.1 hypothetical protein CXF93_10910 [Moritella sp. Urea-trap-13]